MNNTHDIETMTYHDYILRIEAYKLQKVDQEEMLALQAWLNRGVNATETRGSKEYYKYKRFDEFFDKEQRENEVLGKVTNESKLGVKFDKQFAELLKKGG